MFLKREKRKYYLSVIAIFKNEAHCITEWIEHYLKEGVEHFYLINNDSNDDFLIKIKKYIETGFITLVHDKSRWSQVELYNKYFLSKKNESDWFLVCDLDEFIYARKEFQTIAKYLKTRESNVGLIRIPWKMFGSSGYQSQPAELRKSFIKRCSYNGKINPGMNTDSESLGKVIVRTKYLSWMDIHHVELAGNCMVEDSMGMKMSYEKGPFVLISEDLLANAYLHLNHYPLQSRDWFLEVKASRGAADTKKHEEIRDLDYFNRFDKDSNVTMDIELAEKVRCN